MDESAKIAHTTSQKDRPSATKTPIVAESVKNKANTTKKKTVKKAKENQLIGNEPKRVEENTENVRRSSRIRKTPNRLINEDN